MVFPEILQVFSQIRVFSDSIVFTTGERSLHCPLATLLPNALNFPDMLFSVSLGQDHFGSNCALKIASVCF